MRTSTTKNSIIIGISIVLGASLLSVGISNAAGTSIKACAMKSNGAMRLIDLSKKCKKSERTLTWGTQGTAGATGTAGVTGTAGATGATGTPGTSGTGLSNAYSFQFDSTSGLPIRNDLPDFKTNSLWIKEIPAGKYVFSISSQVTYDARTTHTENVSLACMLTTKGSYGEAAADSTSVLWPKQNTAYPTGRPYYLSFQPFTTGKSQIANLSATSTFQLTSPTKPRLVCAMEEPVSDTGLLDESISLDFVSLIFTAVDTNTAIDTDPQS